MCKMNSHNHCSSNLPKCPDSHKPIYKKKSFYKSIRKDNYADSSEVDQPDKLAQLAMRIKGLQQEPHRRQSVAHRRISAEKNSTCNVGDSSLEPSDKLAQLALRMKPEVHRRPSAPPKQKSVDNNTTFNVEESGPAQPDKLANLAVRIKGLQQEPHRKQSVPRRRASVDSNASYSKTEKLQDTPLTGSYVALYDFKGRHDDEIDLSAGCKITITDVSNPDWWKGEYDDRSGYFPSKYCCKLNPGEKPLQVVRKADITQKARDGNIRLLRDQIVFQIGDENEGYTMIRTASNQRGYCPLKHLREVGRGDRKDERSDVSRDEQRDRVEEQQEDTHSLEDSVWERLRENQLKRMKNICVGYCREFGRSKKLACKQSFSLNPNWYTENIYGNKSIDLDSDYQSDSFRLKKFDIAHDELPIDEIIKSCYMRTSHSCKDLRYLNPQSCCVRGGYKCGSKLIIPKSYSLNLNKINPFDEIDYYPKYFVTKKDLTLNAGDISPENCFRNQCSACFKGPVTSRFRCRKQTDQNYVRGRRDYKENKLVRSGSQKELPNTVCNAHFCAVSNPHRGCPSNMKMHSPHDFECKLCRYAVVPSEKSSRNRGQIDFDVDWTIKQSKSAIEVKPPEKYDEYSTSDSTGVDLEDFNFDFEKYWEEIENESSPVEMKAQKKYSKKGYEDKSSKSRHYRDDSRSISKCSEVEGAQIKQDLLSGMLSPPNNGYRPANYHSRSKFSAPFRRFSFKVFPKSINTHDNIYMQRHCKQDYADRPLNLINNIFSIYKPNKYLPMNCYQFNNDKPFFLKKSEFMNHVLQCEESRNEYVTSIKRPLIVTADQPRFEIIPRKTGLRVSPLYDSGYPQRKRQFLRSTARPLSFHN
ncbi:uncharacterized protein LOC119646397 [Hermetia illucens]|uniref:uncharacterized protein LOC119646397 n=1 Tax=Hermetia illucens TaxID=343691 RepID=UPI0018CC205B|nr:uncharacterized protein LOC119646397 [Hermetia illucens]XP_037902769.1 uncharacterized protein LOC119646397 [Hermetia illucens]